MPALCNSIQYKNRWLYLAVALFIFNNLVYAQSRYWVYFRNKGPETKAYLADPAMMLSQRSLDRRSLQRISVNSSDIPVSATYLRALTDRGLKIWGVSKWLNAVCVSGAIGESLPAFVSHIDSEVRSDLNLCEEREVSGEIAFVDTVHALASYFQQGMLGLPAIGKLGFTGKGIRIAVFDAGFSRVNASLFSTEVNTEKRVLATQNFVYPNTSVYQGSAHGTQVLSLLAANKPGLYKGAAPDAEYLLVCTEDPAHETHTEELNYLEALEWADSAGADIVSASLSYTAFDAGQAPYSYAQMDGHTLPVTRGVNMAAAKGILVVVSAGNQGRTRWHYVGTPSDADSVLCVGSVDAEGSYASFSSVGPNASGHIKPDVVALGVGTAVINPEGKIIRSSGTSFSAPQVAGLAACLWQAYPKANAMQIKDAILQSGSQATTPNNQIGYGIPNGLRALAYLKKLLIPK